MRENEDPKALVCLGDNLRIGIDLCSLRRRATGIEHYAKSLAKALLEIDKENEYVVFLPKGISPRVLSMNRQFKTRACPSRFQLLCEQVWLPLVARAECLDLLHFPAFPPSPLHDVKMVLTVHDATVWRLPHTASRKGLYYFKGLYGLAIRKSRRLIAHSENSRDEIIRYANTPREKIVAIYPAPHEVFQPIADEHRLTTARVRFGLPSSFILTVGTIEPRKNHLTLIEAYDTLRRRSRLKHALVIVGRRAWGYGQVARRINQSPFKKDIIVTDFVSLWDLAAIYNLAQVFVYPSIYEGFGLPPLEAMSCGCPVVVSRSSSLPEIVSDAGVFVDPSDAGQMAEAIQAVLEDSGMRESLVVRGFERAKAFGWPKAVSEILRVYQQAAAT